MGSASSVLDDFLKLKYAQKNDNANFYIQCKGLHSGRPLKKYIPNSFAVFTADKFAFEKCFCIWKSKAFYVLLRGSVIPFISIRETKTLFLVSFRKMEKADERKIKAIRDIDMAVFNAKEKINFYRQMQHALAVEVFK